MDDPVDESPTILRRAVDILTLFGSTGTLVCCALPAALAALAGGSAVIALTSAFPWLVPLSRHKHWIFLASGVLLLANSLLVFRPRGRFACPVRGGRGCETAGRFSKGMLGISAVIWSIGAFFAYLLVPVLRFLEGG